MPVLGTEIIDASDIDTAMTRSHRSEPAAPKSAGVLAGFEDSAAAAGQIATQAGTVSSMAREEGELKAAIVLARSMPRNELQGYERIIKACKRPKFADDALYAFPRGGSTIEGPSIKLAREMARVWGNIRYGMRVVTEDKDTIHIRGYAFDLETNTLAEAEDKFTKLIQRKVMDYKTKQKTTEWVVPDERDLRELVNRRASFMVRNMILQLMPSDIVEDACAACNETLRAAAAGELQIGRPEAIKRLVVAFSELGVTPQMLGEKLGHTLEQISDVELAQLRKEYLSIYNGNSKISEHFTLTTVAPANAGATGNPGASRESSVLGKLTQPAPTTAAAAATVAPAVDAEQTGATAAARTEPDQQADSLLPLGSPTNRPRRAPRL